MTSNYLFLFFGFVSCGFMKRFDEFISSHIGEHRRNSETVHELELPHRERFLSALN